MKARGGALIHQLAALIALFWKVRVEERLHVGYVAGAVRVCLAGFRLRGREGGGLQAGGSAGVRGNTVGQVSGD